MDGQLQGIMTDGQAKPKSFWDRPEGKFGRFVVAGIIVGGGFLLYKALPFIITLLSNTLTAALLGLALVVLGMVVFNKRFQTIVWYMFQSVMRALTGIMIDIDPISILQSYLGHLRQALATMSKNIGRLNGQIRNLDSIMANNEHERQEALSIAGKAKETGKKSALVLNARHAGRLKQSNMTLQALRDKLALLLRVLEKMNETAEFLYQDTEDEVKVKTQEYEAIRAGYSAFKAALSVIKGDPNKKAVFDQTMESMTTDFATKVGEIEEFMRMSSGVIEGIDLQNMVFEEDALADLEKWEQRADSLILKPGEKQMLLASAYNTDSLLDSAGVSQASPERVPVETKRRGQGKSSSLDKFFD